MGKLPMLTKEQMIKIDPELAKLSDEELFALRDSFYNLAQLAFDFSQEGKKGDSKSPTRSFPPSEIESKL